ncbi:MAG TPA: sigma-70 family RNA polymerase sigma factor [Acidimicrobiales bacterium]|nr:sigma-70 family RNA polymerase sigma factor [Acidimicrobiales bacterium]
MTTLLTGGGTRSREALDDDVDLVRDRALVTRAQAGEREAFDDLYARYYRRLYRFCLRRLHDSYEAEDVAQEAFSRAWRALPTFAGDRRFYPWLSVIAAHLCTDVLRRRNRSTPVAEFHQSNVASTEDGGEELMIAAVDSDLVARAFKRLSDRHQRILNLREGSGWSYQKIADHEGVGITAVETLLWRARQALKREFAALAGVEGRSAAFIGGMFSLAALRRLLRLPLHHARRLVHLAQGGAGLAVGSAAAATAMVVAATLSGPTAQAPAQLPTANGQSGTVSVAGVTPTSPGPAGLQTRGAPGSGTTTGTSASSLPGGTLPTTPGVANPLSGTPTVDGAAGALGNAPGLIGGAAGVPVAGIAGSLPLPGAGVGTQSVNGSSLDGAAAAIGQLPLAAVSGGGDVVQVGGTSTGTSANTSSTLGPVGSTVSGTGGSSVSDVGGLLGSTPAGAPASTGSATGTQSTSGTSACSPTGLAGTLANGVTIGRTSTQDCGN